jgi:hypothetical protein
MKYLVSYLHKNYYGEGDTLSSQVINEHPFAWATKANQGNAPPTVIIQSWQVLSSDDISEYHKAVRSGVDLGL